MNFFWSGVPGKLAIHSAFVIWGVMSRTLRSFRSTATGRARVISTEPGPSSSYPVARIFSEYEPDPSFDEGKANRPRSSLTTLSVTVEPAFFALTTTPSIAPSSAELTRPVRAVEVWAAAGATPPPARNAIDIRPALTTSKRRLVMDDSLVDPLRLAIYFSPIRFRVTPFNVPGATNHDRPLRRRHLERNARAHRAGRMRPRLQPPPDRSREGRAEIALVPRHEPQRADPGDRGQRRPGRKAGDDLAVGRGADVLRRKIRKVPAEGRGGAAGVLAGARERGERHERHGQRNLHAVSRKGSARACDRNVQVDVEQLYEGLGRQAGKTALLRRGRGDHRRLRSLRRDCAHEGRAARSGRGFWERRALGRCDGRAPGRAKGDEVLNQPTTRAACWLWPSVIPRAFIQS